MGTQVSSLKGAQPAPNFRPISVVAKRLGGLRCLLVCRQASAQATLCSMGTQLPQKKGTALTQFLAHVYCDQTAGWMKTPLGTDVDLGPGHSVLDWDPAPSRKGHSSPRSFGPMSVVATVAHLGYC